MRRIFDYALGLMVIALITSCSSLANKQHAAEKCIKIGQEWRYDHRDGEENSRVVIVDVLMTKDKNRLYVIRVTGVVIDHPNFKNYFPDLIPYFVITEQGLQASITQLEGEAAWNRYYDRHYQNWRKQQQGTDYFGVTIKDKIRTLEEILNVKLGA